MAAHLAAPAVEFINNPFHGNINPDTKTGSQLYLKATASIPEEDKFALNMSTARMQIHLDGDNLSEMSQQAQIRQEIC